MGEIKDKTISGIKWSAIERFSVQGIQFLIGLILARLLTPTDYGTVGMLGIFIAISQTFIDSGFSNALIRKIDRTDTDFCTVFYFNIAVSIICYAILFAVAPFIADFFNYPLLKDILRVISINLVINSFNSIQNARFTIAVDFKTIAKCSLLSTIISGCVGIFLAYMGYGVWALVYQQITNSVVNTICLWSFSKWYPKLVYSWQSFQELFSYGGKLLMAGLLHTAYSNMTTLVIGKFYTPKDLGLYSRGESLATLPCSNITGILQRVTFPIFAQLQNDDEKLIGVYRKYIKLTSMVIFFIMVLLAALAKPIIIVLITEKWLGAVIFAQIMCFAWMFDHICAMNLNVLQVKGRSDLFLRLEIIKKTISFLILITAIPFGVLAICISKIIYTQIAVFINTFYTGRLFNLGYIAQIKDFSKYFILAIGASAPAFFLSHTTLNPFAIIFIGAFTAIIIYCLVLHISADASFKELVEILRSRLKH